MNFNLSPFRNYLCLIFVCVCYLPMYKISDKITFSSRVNHLTCCACILFSSLDFQVQTRRWNSVVMWLCDSIKQSIHLFHQRVPVACLLVCYCKCVNLCLCSLVFLCIVHPAVGCSHVDADLIIKGFHAPSGLRWSWFMELIQQIYTI